MGSSELGRKFRGLLKLPACPADHLGMIENVTLTDSALADLERLLVRLIPDPATRESVIAAAEMYGDARADEALSALPR